MVSAFTGLPSAGRETDASVTWRQGDGAGTLGVGPRLEECKDPLREPREKWPERSQSDSCVTLWLTFHLSFGVTLALSTKNNA